MKNQGQGEHTYRRLTKVLLVTLAAVFSILIAGGFLIFKNEAPRPQKMVDPAGTTIISHSDMLSGQAVYEKYGLTDYGTLLGNGSYLGPDYTAESLHIYLRGMDHYYANTLYGKSYNSISDFRQDAIKAKVKKEIRVNRYDKATDTLKLTNAQVAGVKYLQKYYRHEFVNNPRQAGLPENMINQKTTDEFMSNGNKVDQLTSYFFWTAWVSSTNRPNREFTYTNNWPYDLDAGNVMPAEAMVWTAISVAVLVAGVGVIIWYQRRYHFDMDAAYSEGNMPVINADAPITTSQRKSAKYFMIVMLMFLVQVLLGALMAHYYSENTFFGLDLQNIWPFNLAKSWHLQLAIFWIATSWLGAGVYLTPRVLGREPKHQGVLVDILFWALIVVVGGSMLGEWGAILNWKFFNNKWWLFGHFGWEYIELGKFWQILLIIGMLLWVVILMRGFIPKMRKKLDGYDRTRLITLLFMGSIAIPAFYLATLFILPHSHVTFADYWRWWIVHLWVEGIFESFAVILIGYLMVDMKLTTIKSTIRALYFQLILLLGSGVVGMGHHYFWEGDHSIWLALGACFSALEVIPLCLLIWEAWTHYRVVRDSGIEFPYKPTFVFLAWTGIWNAIGAGALGFLINAPAINYFEHGTQWTSAHAHTSMAGVYGMLSLAIMLFVLRNVSKKEIWTPKLHKMISWSAWLMNIGLAGMTIIALLPIGYLQLADALKHGYWHARLLSFYRDSPVVEMLWARIVPDSIFIIGVVIMLFVVAKIFFNLKPATADHEDVQE
ncbi:nitric-oxide reductase large subunit [Paucilactobacillus kaifaensis]|uniref:nitric-oxide reductase large subunit n=1 Tax=Paucilactobacillus kaifaensis TaxID=2559921 RepID=UPI0010F5F929|nr:cbb3-type cytochrome c oxidase subunit I [Paucilactobacillus kaifaensis]